MKSGAAAALLIVMAGSPLAAGQNPRAASPSPAAAAAAQELAAGWGALAAGRTDAAEVIADRLMKSGPRRHDALSLKIAARVQAGQPEKALDEYE